MPVSKETTSAADELGIGQQTPDEYGFLLASGGVATVNGGKALPAQVAADVDARVAALMTSNDPGASLSLLMEYELIAKDVTINAGRDLIALVPVTGTDWWEVLTTVDEATQSERAETKEAALSLVAEATEGMDESEYYVSGA